MPIVNYLHTVVISQYWNMEQWQSWADGLILCNDNLEDWIYKVAFSNDREKLFLEIIYECGTHEIYSRLCDNSPMTLKFVEEATDILKTKKINLVDVSELEKYTYQECGGWGTCFDGRFLSKFI